MSGTKFVGFLVTEETDDHLRIQALLQGVTRSTLIRDIIQSYIDKSKWDSEDLIERYASYLYNQWDIRWRDTMLFREYLSEQRREMEHKHKLPLRLTMLVVSRCEELHRQTQSPRK